jgi:hypothetical protein
MADVRAESSFCELSIGRLYLYHRNGQHTPLCGSGHRVWGQG